MMRKYHYEALDNGGRTVCGAIAAASEEQIIEKLHGLGYYPMRVIRERVKLGDIDVSALPGLRSVFHRVKPKHLTAFSRQLATLLDAGLPILRALRVLQEQTDSRVFQDKIGEMAKDIEAGSTLSEAMGRHSRIFNPLYVNLVRAGEIGGVLERVLTKLADLQERRAALVSRMRTALMYPLSVLAIATIIVSVILVYVLPKFEQIYAGLGEELPWLTLQMVAASDFLRQHGVIALCFIAVAYVVFRKVRLTREGRYVTDRLALEAPVFGDLMLKASIARFAGTLSTMIQAGVPILQALDIVRDTSGNEVVGRTLERVHASVKDGETIHRPLQESRIFPPLVTHMVAVGEETGAIDQMLEKVAESYQRDVDDTVDAFTSLIEPFLMVFLGVVIGTIVIALYLPIIYLPGIATKF
ncbi:type II secretion system F family protein [Candidatus Sumerlaeota bacterium]|nr:type II secretion system F family protein [Candidatus Sumerlaeota bacterium]